jgi:cardiolipin synthase
MPHVDRFVLDEARRTTPVVLENARGPLSYAQSQAILADLKKRSPDTSLLDRHLAVEQAVAGAPLTIGNRVTLLEDGEATYPAMLAAIKSAKHHVHLEVYIFEESKAGHEFLDALVARAKAGVQVRVIYDSFGSKTTSKEFFELLKSGGVQLLEYRPVDAGSLLTKGPLLNQRDHRKLMIVDGRIAFLGGINISEVYAGSSARVTSATPFEKRPWRDTQVQVEGPVVDDLQKAFIANWEREKKERLSGPGFFPKLSSVGPHVMRALESAPDGAFNPLYVTLLSAIRNAENEIRITVAYFVPDDQLIDALKEAARRGVKVELVLPKKTDGWVVLYAGRSFYEDLLSSGIRIYERKDRLLHSKYAVIDGVWATVGSSNMDWRSLLHNLELNAVIIGPDFGKRVNALFDKDLASSDEITLEQWRRRPITERLKEAASRAWAYLL